MKTAIIAVSIIFTGLTLFVLLPENGLNKIKGTKNAMITLPEIKHDSSTSIEKALSQRESARNYKSGPVTLKELSQLLWAAQGITRDGLYRTAPSAGALYPIELYVAAGKIEGLEAGIYRYVPENHKLRPVKKGDVRNELEDACLGQSAVDAAPAVIVIGAVYERVTGKYHERGKRYVHIEAGHVAQNIYLQCESLALGTVDIGAFDDNAVEKVMSMEKNTRALMVMPVGKK